MWSAITGFFADSLAFLEGVFSFTGHGSWGWAIIALTLITRILLLPLNIKQTRSMRKMQEVGPKVKAIQKKHKVEKELMKSNPEKYRMLKQKANEEVMALYKEEGVNPAGGCLPLVAQMPVFFAVFSVLRSTSNFELLQAPFYFFTDKVGPAAIVLKEAVLPPGAAEAGLKLGERTLENGAVEYFVDGLRGGLGGATSSASWPGWLLIVAMGATMFITQKQMMGRNSAADPQQQQMQKTMMYVMPVFLAFISLNLPLGVLLYWVTTNIWQLIQQQIMFRDLNASQVAEDVAKPNNRGKGTGKPSPKAAVSDDLGNAKAGDHATKRKADREAAATAAAKIAKNEAAGGRKKRRHLPGEN